MKLEGYILKTGHGTGWRETLDEVDPEVRHLWKPVYSEVNSRQEPIAEVVAGNLANRLQWVSDEAHANTPVGTKLFKELPFPEGWKEAAIGWAVCASIHRQYAKGRDALFTTRQADFVRHAENARAKLPLPEEIEEVNLLAMSDNDVEFLMHVLTKRIDMWESYVTMVDESKTNGNPIHGTNEEECRANIIKARAILDYLTATAQKS